MSCAWRVAYTLVLWKPRWTHIGLARWRHPIQCCRSTSAAPAVVGLIAVQVLRKDALGHHQHSYWSPRTYSYLYCGHPGSHLVWRCYVCSLETHIQGAHYLAASSNHQQSALCSQDTSATNCDHPFAKPPGLASALFESKLASVYSRLPSCIPVQLRHPAHKWSTVQGE